MLKIKNPVVDSKLMEWSFPQKLSLKSIQIIWGNPYMFLSRIYEYFVGNKAKGRILKRVFQENKARQIFRKTNIFYPLIRSRTCAYHRVRNVHFSENLACFVFLKNPFWDSLFFALLPTSYWILLLLSFSIVNAFSMQVHGKFSSSQVSFCEENWWVLR